MKSTPFPEKRYFYLLITFLIFLIPEGLTASESYRIFVVSSKFYLGKVDDKYISGGKKNTHRGVFKKK